MAFPANALLTADFKLNRAIVRSFTVFSVIIMPDGSMLDTMTLAPALKPLATNMPGLGVPFSYALLSVVIPPGTAPGQYEIVAAFFDPSKPITGRGDAFLDASAKFTVR